MFKIFVGNISYQTPERTLEKLFSTYGIVDEVIYVKDEKTGDPRGFAFVLMPDSVEGRTAITELDGRRVNGRPIAVSEAGQRQAKKQKSTGRSDGEKRPLGRNTRGARVGSPATRRPHRGNRPT